MGRGELPENCDAKANSKSQRWLKFVLMPTISILENEGREEELCQVLLTEPLPAHPESQAAQRSSSMDLEAYFFCTRRRPGLRILNSVDMADRAPYLTPVRRASMRNVEPACMKDNYNSGHIL